MCFLGFRVPAVALEVISPFFYCVFGLDAPCRNVPPPLGGFPIFDQAWTSTRTFPLFVTFWVVSFWSEVQFFCVRGVRGKCSFWDFFNFPTPPISVMPATGGSIPTGTLLPLFKPGQGYPTTCPQIGKPPVSPHKIHPIPPQPGSKAHVQWSNWLSPFPPSAQSPSPSLQTPPFFSTALSTTPPL